MATGKRKAKVLPIKTIDQYFVKTPLSSPNTETTKKNITDENAKANNKKDRRPLSLLTPKLRQPLADIGGSAAVVSCQKTPTPTRATFAVLRDEDICRGLDEAPQPKAPAVATKIAANPENEPEASDSDTLSSISNVLTTEAADHTNSGRLTPADGDTASAKTENNSLNTQSVPLVDSLASNAVSSPALSMSSPPNNASQEDESDEDTFFDMFITRTKRPLKINHHHVSPALKRTNQGTGIKNYDDEDSLAKADEDEFDGLTHPHSPFFEPISLPEENKDLIFSPTIEFSISNSFDDPDLDNKQVSSSEHDHSDDNPQAQFIQPTTSTKALSSPKHSQDSSLHPTIPYPQTQQFDAHVPFPIPRGKTILEKFGIKKD